MNQLISLTNQNNKRQYFTIPFFNKITDIKIRIFNFTESAIIIYSNNSFIELNNEFKYTSLNNFEYQLWMDNIGKFNGIEGTAIKRMESVFKIQYGNNFLYTKFD